MSATPGDPSKVFNVLVPVVQNVAAATPEEAIALVRAALDATGFCALTEGFGSAGQADAFDAEPGTEPDTLPAPGRAFTSHAGRYD